MLNSVSMVGRIITPVFHVDKNAYINIQVKKPVSSQLGMEEFEVLTIRVWSGLEAILTEIIHYGMMISLRGRLSSEGRGSENTYNAMIEAEVVEILDKHFIK